ncbi:MAG TPA: GNAT family N-acetyltransferase, partial [Pseudolysinimonas sp.]|nr:GNAT family N-acetyltransferase [Pseudolysinimonas sp.]
MGSYEVRDAEARDAESVARVHVDAWRETYAGVLAEHYFSADAYERRRRFWTGYLAMDPRPGRAVVAERDGSIVGFANAGQARGADVEKGFPPVRPL